MSQIVRGHTHTVTAYGRARILQSASQLFARRGFNGVSISDVAEAAGVVKSAIYHHFASKEALYMAVLEQAVEQSHAQMAVAAIGETWREQLRGACMALGRLVGPHSHVLGLILEGMAQNTPRMSPTNEQAATALRRRFISTISSKIGAGVAAGELNPIDPDLASLCLIGVITAALQATTRSFDEAQVDLAVNLFLNGAVARPVAVTSKRALKSSR